jgi:hypothetical protein
VCFICLQVIHDTNSPQPSRNLSFPKLNLADLDVQLDDVEEIDLTNDSPPMAPTKCSDIATRSYCNPREINSNSGLGDCSNPPRQSPSFSCTTRIQSSDDVWLRAPEVDDECFPPSELLVGMEDISSYDGNETVGVLSASHLLTDSLNYRKIHGGTPQATENVFDFKAFRYEEKDPSISMGGAVSSPSQPEAKRLKLAEDTSERTLPSWVNEVDPDLIKYFEGSVDFV